MSDIELTKAAMKALNKMPKNQADLVMDKIEQLARAPHELANNIKKLQGSDYSRLRVGNWRIIFTETNKGYTILIIDIGPRGSIYE